MGTAWLVIMRPPVARVFVVAGFEPAASSSRTESASDQHSLSRTFSHVRRVETAALTSSDRF
jgi:hypothetical protein